MVLDANKEDYSPLSAAYFNELELAIMNSLHGKKIYTISSDEDDSPTYYIASSDAAGFHDLMESIPENSTVILLRGDGYTVDQEILLNHNITILGYNYPEISASGGIICFRASGDCYVNGISFDLSTGASGVIYKSNTSIKGAVTNCKFAMHSIASSAGSSSGGTAIGRSGDPQGIPVMVPDEHVIISGNYCEVDGQYCRFIGFLADDYAPKNGTVTSATANSIYEFEAGWVSNIYTGQEVEMTSGLANGQTAPIVSNTSDTLTLGGTISPVPSNGDDFTINDLDGNDYLSGWVITDNSLYASGKEAYFIFGGKSNGLIISNNFIHSNINHASFGVIYLHSDANRVNITDNKFVGDWPDGCAGSHLFISAATGMQISNNTFHGISTIIDAYSCTDSIFEGNACSVSNKSNTIINFDSCGSMVVSNNNFTYDGDWDEPVVNDRLMAFLLGEDNPGVDASHKFVGNTIDGKYNGSKYLKDVKISTGSSTIISDNTILGRTVKIYTAVKGIINGNSIDVNDDPQIGVVEIETGYTSSVTGNTVRCNGSLSISEFDQNATYENYHVTITGNTFQLDDGDLFSITTGQHCIISNNIMYILDGALDTDFGRHAVFSNNTIRFKKGINFVIGSNSSISGNRFFEQPGATGDIKINDGSTEGAITITDNILDSATGSPGVFKIEGTYNMMLVDNILDVAGRSLDIDFSDGSMINDNRFLQYNSGSETFYIDMATHCSFSNNDIGVPAGGGGHIHLHYSGIIIGNDFWGKVGSGQAITDGSGGDYDTVLGNQTGGWLDQVNGANTIKNYNHGWPDTTNPLDHDHDGTTSGGPSISVGNLSNATSYRLYAGGAAENIVPCPVGTTDYFLRGNGASALPEWTDHNTSTGTASETIHGAGDGETILNTGDVNGSIVGTSDLIYVPTTSTTAAVQSAYIKYFWDLFINHYNSTANPHDVTGVQTGAIVQALYDSRDWNTLVPTSLSTLATIPGSVSMVPGDRFRATVHFQLYVEGSLPTYFEYRINAAGQSVTIDDYAYNPGTSGQYVAQFSWSEEFTATATGTTGLYVQFDAGNANRISLRRAVLQLDKLNNTLDANGKNTAL